MGNSSTKEQRPHEPTGPGPAHGHRLRDSSITGQQGADGERLGTPAHGQRPGRTSRPDLSFLGIGSSSNNVSTPAPEVRRETKQEREARKREKEREAREKERERSMKEEHVDGGYVVTQGVYTGPEDFSKTAVRQLMIERRIAPFWRGLNDFKEDWTEHQLVAAARGLPIPAADEIPPEDPQSTESPRTSLPNISLLTVPITSRTQSYNSDASATLSPSHPAFSLPSPTSPLNPSHTPPSSSSPFRPRSKTLASLTTSSKTATEKDMTPREIQLPKDPYVHGQAMEAFLYKDATECPICFIYYPPYLNKTRCCDQPICSECFVQIKRPDPHPPEHEHHDASNPAPPPSTQPAPPAAETETLVSEPANCPYCQQPEFGVTYEPPPFRRGLAYTSLGQGRAMGSIGSAMSSSSSLNSMGSPTLKPAGANRRRTTSISADSSMVITTDKVRPDWATKLANARNHAARRSAAATALHTAAYLMSNNNSTDSRSFGFTSRSRFGRHRTDSPGGSGAATPSGGGPDIAARLAAFSTIAEQHAARRREAMEGGENGAPGHRRSRMDDLEDMMMMEAIRLSLAAEEERKRKNDKEAKKEAKKREKADKKAEKAAKRSLYNSGNSSASASGSALSLSLPGVGRRRGNSGNSLFMREGEANNADKGKSVDRGIPNSEEPSTAPMAIEPSKAPPSTGLAPLPSSIDGVLPSPVTTAPEKPSHLRQMSNASSPASSFMESVPGSLRNGFNKHGSSSSLESPNASGTNLGGTPDRDGDGGSAGTEPMFNFRSLAAMVGREEEKENDANHIEYSDKPTNSLSPNTRIRGESSASASNVVEDPMEESVATIKVEILENGTGNTLNGLSPKQATPELMITPVTPAATDSMDEDQKQLGTNIGFGTGHGRHITQ